VCGGVFDYIHLTDDGRAELADMRTERLVELETKTTGELIKWFVRDLHELHWMFGWDTVDYAYGVAKTGRLDEAVEILKGAE
jgi:hypothetical protein